MAAISERIVEEFCKLCNWTYESWVTHRVLFDDNPNVDALLQDKCGHFFSRLSIITQEYSLHQIAKLHDAAVQKNDTNLSIDYVIQYGGWDQETDTTLRQLYSKLDQLAKSIRPARHKTLSHNDLSTILNDVTLGDFAKDADCEYFAVLQEFVDVVHQNSIGGPYPFNDIAKSDAQILLATIHSK